MSSLLAALRNNRAFQALHYRDFRTVSVCQIFGNLGFWMDELSRGWLIGSQRPPGEPAVFRLFTAA